MNLEYAFLILSFRVESRLLSPGIFKLFDDCRFSMRIEFKERRFRSFLSPIILTLGVIEERNLQSDEYSTESSSVSSIVECLRPASTVCLSSSNPLNFSFLSR